MNVNQSAELSVLVHSIFATFKFIHYKPFFDFLSWWSSSNKFASFHFSSFKFSISIQHMTIITHNYTQIQIDKFQNALNSVVKIDGSGSLYLFHSIKLHFIFFDFFVVTIFVLHIGVVLFFSCFNLLFFNIGSSHENHYTQIWNSAEINKFKKRTKLCR